MNQASSQNFLAFYRGKSLDAEDRRIEDIWQWDFSLLETTHDYIQWLFPLKEKSGFNRQAPVLNDEVIAIFRMSEELRGRLLTSLKVMLAFYGFDLLDTNTSEIEIRKSVAYEERKLNWLRPRNHNYLRLTRILKSLCLLGAEPYAQALFDCLTQLYQKEPESIGEIVFDYWRKAAFENGE